MEGRRPLIRSAALFFTTLFAVACSGSESPGVSPPPEPPVEQLVVSITPKHDSLLLGTSRALVAAVTTRSGAPRNVPVTWASLAPDIVSVTNGTMTAFAPGQALIVASVGTSADTATIRVTLPVYELRLTPNAVSTMLGDTLLFEAHITGPAGARTRVNNVTWSLSDSTAAQFVDAGTVTTLSTGELEVYATVGGTTAMAAVSVSRAAVASLAFVPNNLTLSVGEQGSLRLVARDSRGRVIQGVVPTITSSRPSVATADNEGIVTAVGTGGAIITAVADGKSTTATVNVSAAAAASVRLTLPNDSLGTGRTMQATATPLDASGNPIIGRPIAWQSSNPSVATISSAGVITSLVPGQTTISVICDGQVASQRIYVVTPQATTLQVSPTSASVAVGTSAPLSAVVRDQFGVAMTNLPVTWSSTTPTIASVSNTGVVTGVAIGSASVRATYGPLSATVPITVPGVPVATVTLTPATVNIVQGGTAFLIAVARDAAGNVLSNRPVTWTSSTPTVATVSAGQVIGVSVGTSTITATVEGKSAQSTVTVTAAPPQGPALILVTLNSSTLAIDQTTNARAVAYDQYGTPLTASFTYSSGNTQIASVSQDGRVRAIAQGTTTVTAASNGVTGITSVTVQPSAALPVDTVVLSLASSTIVVGDTTQLTVETRDSTGAVVTGRTIAFTSSNTNVLRVSTTGQVFGRNVGVASITATSEGKSATVSLTVTDVAPPPTTAPVATVTVALGSSALTVGQGTQGSATLRDSTGAVLTGRLIVWSSSNPSAATVSQSGYVTAIGAGTATISAQSEGKNGGAGVTVQASTQTVATVSVSLSPGNITVGSSAQATAIARDSAGAAINGLSVTWAVSPSGSVASISGGASSTTSALGIGVGTATISATISGVTGSASLAVAAALPSTIQVPTLPTLLNFSYPQVTGTTRLVKAGDNLQNVLNQAQRGDEIVIAAGATFTGNFILPAKTGTAANGWILIRSDKSASLPALGTRVTPAHAGLMPKIITHNSSAALRTAPSASGWWISGVEMSLVSGLATNYGIVLFGEGSSAQNALSQVPSDLVLDRVYVHATPTTPTSRCISLNSARSQVTDSYVHECHASGFDSQAIAGWNGPGPFKIVNNTLAGAGENIMFGGSDPAIANLIPSDIEIRRNYIYTPASWKGVWTKKNLLETKNAQRLLIEGNVLDGSWTDGQVGIGIALKSANQSGRCTWCASRDITFRYNIMRNIGQPFGLSGREGSNPYAVGERLTRLLIEHNIVEDVNVGIYQGDGRFMLVQHEVHDMIIRHNTMTTSGTQPTFITFAAPPSVVNTVIEDNIFTRGLYGLMGESGAGIGTAALQNVNGTANFTNNVIIGSKQTQPYPTGTTWVSTLSQAQAIANAGANTSLVTAATAGIVIP